MAELKEQVQEVLNKLRPFLQRDGGDVELVDIEDGVVKVRLMGACGSCPSSTITLKAGTQFLTKLVTIGTSESIMKIINITNNIPLPHWK